MILYGKPGSGYAIQWRTNLMQGTWQPVLTNLTVTTNLFLDITPPPGNGPVNFYRALRPGSAVEKILSLAQANDTNVVLSLRGMEGRAYRVQFTPTLSPPALQTLGTATPGSDGRAQFTDTNGWWRTERYYRFVWP